MVSRFAALVNSISVERDASPFQQPRDDCAPPAYIKFRAGFQVIFWRWGMLLVSINTVLDLAIGLRRASLAILRYCFGPSRSHDPLLRFRHGWLGTFNNDLLDCRRPALRVKYIAALPRKNDMYRFLFTHLLFLTVAKILYSHIKLK